MSQDLKTHWVLTYVMVTGDRFRESTRTADMEPVTEREMKEGLVEVIRERTGTPLPTIYVRDQTRGDSPTLVFLGRLSHVELERDLQEGEDPEAERHLELVLEPGLEPGTVDPIRERDLQADKSLPWNRTRVPAGPDRFA